MPLSSLHSSRLTRAYLFPERLSHNMRMLQRLVGKRPLWPCIKANAYGHGAEIIAAHLKQLGYDTFGVADVEEAVVLIDAGIQANYIVLSAMLPEHSEALVAYGCEPVVCTEMMLDALAQQTQKQNKRVSIHVKVDTGMGRIGISPEQVQVFLERCSTYPAIHVRSIMSHFPCADEVDKAFSCQQIKVFKQVVKVSRTYNVQLHHIANSAAIFDLPESYFSLARPGIAIYGLPPSSTITNPYCNELKPVLELKSRVVFLKEVAAGIGLSYGHIYTTRKPSLIATVPIGYGDGLRRNLSNRLDMLIDGVRCPQVGHITMDMSLVDVSALRGKVMLGDEVVVIGSQGDDQITAEEMADKLKTINYEIVTGISHRVPRIVVNKD